jgi:hypothetical protein
LLHKALRYFLNIDGLSVHIESEKLVRNLIELMHIIRPMRQNTSVVRAEMKEDKKLRVVHLDTPNELEVPEVQKLYYLRDKDLKSLKLLAPFFFRQCKGRR